MHSDQSRAPGERRLYFEDVEVGATDETPALTITQAHVSLFQGLTGEAPAADPGLVPDLLPLALSSGLGWRIPRPPLVVLAFMGFEWSFSRRLRIGDTIRCRLRVTSRRSMKEGGVIFEDRTILDQRDEVAQSGRAIVLVARRPG